MPSECSVNKSPVAGLEPRMGTFDCSVAFSEVCVRAGCFIDTLESNAQLCFSLHQRDRNEPNPRGGGEQGQETQYSVVSPPSCPDLELLWHCFLDSSQLF